MYLKTVYAKVVGLAIVMVLKNHLVGSLHDYICFQWQLVSRFGQGNSKWVISNALVIIFVLIFLNYLVHVWNSNDNL